ncbi:MAG: ATP-binding protein [Sphingomicrobium sp.]
MAEDNLGLFDTPPGRGETRLGIAIICVLFVALLVVMPVRDIPLGELNAFVPAIDAIMFLGELITAALLYAQASLFRSRALTVLATGYLFAALINIPHALTFPGAFSPDGWFRAGVNTTAWLAVFRRAAFPIAIILYVLLKRADLAAQGRVERTKAKVATGVAWGIGLTLLFTLLATAGHDWLPSYFSNRTELHYSNAVIYQRMLFLLLFVAGAMLLRSRSSVLDLWLLVALSGLLIECLLTLALRSRFTAGFYALFIMKLFSHLSVMLALIVEANRLYRRLALSSSAQLREQEARLMSMDAVTAAISHEVGQPLTAVGLNASAALGWLTDRRPNVDKAIAALREISDAGKRTFEVIKSVRATFANKPGHATEFSLNDLVLETVSLLDRDVVASKVILELQLDEGRAPVLAHRIQIQRVLINLITNAIQSLRSVKHRPRRLVIRTARAGEDVLLDISDTGRGIPPEQLAHIFDPFFTTKATGTGLGLPLCRTIIEDHRGRLWASHGKPDGATFHIMLPHTEAVEVQANEAIVVLTNLEESLSWLREASSDDNAHEIAELQHVVDSLRRDLCRPKP